MKEYEGQLVGGPDDGDLVTASTNIITVISTTELWLDGTKEGAAVTVITDKGAYVWQPVEGTFSWVQESSNCTIRSD